MIENNVEAIVILLFISTIIGSCTVVVNSNNKKEISITREKIKAGLQQCQVIGSSEIVWQKECVNPHKKN